jgi:hypothetical protein
MDNTIDSLRVEFDRQGSLPTTYESQGSDMGLLGGLLGLKPLKKGLYTIGKVSAEPVSGFR